MKQYQEMTEAERRAFDDSLDFAGDDVLPVATTFSDGRSYDWDLVIRATVETAADGRQFVVELCEGKLVRIRELIPHSPPIAV